MRFTSLGARYFCKCTNFDLCSEMQLSYLETISSFGIGVCVCVFKSGFREVLSVELIVLYFQDKTFLSTLCNAPEL